MKSSRMKWTGAALALSLLAVVAVCETTGPAHRPRGEMFGGPMVRVFHQLNLTDAQRTQMHQILAKEKPTVQPLMQQMAQSRYQITQLELNGAFDESQVRPLASQQAQTMSDLIVQRARIESELIQVLTPDQKTKLTQILANHEQRLQSHSQGQTPSQ
jgi:Spy/CpxP family protein refolding chaperone